jgi:NTP pyrophosphatase (non-canonical NTP hydrolase)
MDLTEYQWRSQDFAIYPNRFVNPEYPTLGLTGEAGEIANKVKKMQRDDLSMDDIRADIESEMGDVLWYLAALAEEFGLSLADVAEKNLTKLLKRRAQNAIQGSGDWR